MVQIAANDIKRLGIGSRFLGSGGGEEFSFTESLFKDQLSESSLPVIALTDLKDDVLVAPMVFLGSGAILAEKNYGFDQFLKLFQKIEDSYGRKVDVIAALSIGGGTIFSPAFLASYFKVPLLDADCYGRTLPQMQMMSTNLAGVMPKKSFIINVMGDFFTIECSNFFALERHARRLTNSSGGLCLIVPQVLTGEEAKRGLIAGTLTQAMTIGQIIQDTQDLGVEEACHTIAEYTKGKFVGVGGILSTTGFDLPHPFKRRIVIRNEKEERTWEIWMDNEFNLIFENGKLIGEVPDIITLCDVNTREPLTINQLRLNTNVAIFTMPAPDIWYTEKGLALVRTKDHLQGKTALCGSPSALQRIA